ncbi:MAG: hypothetical protein ACR2PZ_07720 [Pseudomonadales bacterium]
MKISVITSLVVATLGATFPAQGVVAQCIDAARCEPGAVSSVSCSRSGGTNEMCSERPIELVSLKAISPAAPRTATPSSEGVPAASPAATPAPKPESETLTLLALGLLTLLGLRRYVGLHRRTSLAAKR